MQHLFQQTTLCTEKIIFLSQLLPANLVKNFNNLCQYVWERVYKHIDCVPFSSLKFCGF